MESSKLHFVGLEDNTIYVFMSCNNLFYQHLAVAIKSLKFYSSRPIFIYLCVSNKEAELFLKDKMDKLASCIFGYQIIVFPSEKIKYFTLNKSHNISIETFFRIFIGSLVPLELSKILYLDVDVLINSDVAPLYEYDLDTTIGGVVDFYGLNFAQKRIMKIFNIKIESFINAGVLLIDLNKWRLLKYEEKIIRFIRQSNLSAKFDDQDLLNICLSGDITFFERKWNYVLFYGRFYGFFSRRECIYHLSGKYKGDSFLFSNYFLKKKYDFFSSKEAYSVFSDFFYIFINIFFSKPLTSLQFFKWTLFLGFRKVRFYEYWHFSLLLYPPLIIFLIARVFIRFHRNAPLLHKNSLQ